MFGICGMFGYVWRSSSRVESMLSVPMSHLQCYWQAAENLHCLSCKKQHIVLESKKHKKGAAAACIFGAHCIIMMRALCATSIHLSCSRGWSMLKFDCLVLQVGSRDESTFDCDSWSGASHRSWRILKDWKLWRYHHLGRCTAAVADAFAGVEIDVRGRGPKWSKQ